MNHRLWPTILLLPALLVSCIDAEGTMSTRPDQPPCADSSDIMVPALNDLSNDAVDCLEKALASGDGAEFEFTILEDGGRYRAVLQALEDGTVNYFREYPRGGWGYHLRCGDFRLPDGGFPSVDQCDTEYVPAGN